MAQALLTKPASKPDASFVIVVVPADNWFGERHRNRVEVRDKDTYRLIDTISPPTGWEIWAWKVGGDDRSIVFQQYLPN
jgi:hypothetical protein